MLDNSISSATNLGLGKWTRATNPDLAPLGSDTTLSPHITVRGSGTGLSDFYKITITQAMIDGGAVRGSFDIDRGYVPGDPITWASLLKLYNSSGDVIAQGALTRL